MISEEDLDTVIKVIQESLEELDLVEEIPGHEYRGHDKAFAAL